MNMANRKGGGTKLTRSVIVTVRLDPRLHYLACIAARVHRRTLSSFFEWAVESELRNFEGIEQLWNVDDDERFKLLATQHPTLLTYDEQVRWMNHPKHSLGEKHGPHQ